MEEEWVESLILDVIAGIRKKHTISQRPAAVMLGFFGIRFPYVPIIKVQGV